MINAYTASDASDNWKNHVNPVDQTNIDKTIQGIAQYSPTYNEFTTVVLEKLFITIFRRGAWNNKLARFKMGFERYGAWAEEIWVNNPEEEPFDPEGLDVTTRKKPSILVHYYEQNSQAKFKVSVSEEQAQTAFRNAYGVTTLVNTIIAGLADQDNYTEWLKTKRLFAAYAQDPAAYNVDVDNVVDRATASEFAIALQQGALDMSFYTTNYNLAGVRRSTDLSNQVLFISKDIFPRINVDLLSNTFNMGRADYMVNPVIVDDFGYSEIDENGEIIDPDVGKTLAILADRDWFRIWDKLYKVETFRNGSGMFTNYWLHHWALYACSPFANVIRFRVKG